MQKPMVHRVAVWGSWVTLLALSCTASAQDLRKISSRGGWANFRRAEVLKLAGADPKSATVTDLSRRNLIPGRLPAHVRLMVVDDWANPKGAKATFVVAPLNRKAPLRLASDELVRNLAVTTVGTGAKAAWLNGGVYGNRLYPAKVEYLGMSRSKKSFIYNTTPRPGDDVITKKDGKKYRIGSINRSVTLNYDAIGGYRPAESAFLGHIVPLANP